MKTELQMVGHEERVAIARQLSRRIVENYGEAVLAIFIVGSTAKGLDRPYSDLELISIIQDGAEIPPKYYCHQGLVVEITYPQQSQFLKEALRVTANWPLVADQYRNRIMLFEREGWLRQLDKAVAENDSADLKEALRKAAMNMTETLCALQNAKLTGDTWIIVSRGRSVAYAAAGIVLLLNRRYIKTTSQFWNEALACPEQPPRFRDRIEVAAGFVAASPSEMANAAEELYAEVISMVKSRGVSFESKELSV